MDGQILEFTAEGTAKSLSQAIEEFAQRRQSVTALAVPWESEATKVNMAVTVVNRDGWAIQHTNVGTIVLTEQGDNRTRVAAVAHEPDHPDKPKLATLFERFATQLQGAFEVR